jgi:hypothetical protein
MTCTEIKYYLNDFAKGILLDEIRAEIHEHLNSCNVCSKSLDEIISLRLKAGLKHRGVNKEQQVRVKIHKDIYENQDSKSIAPKIFPTISAIGFEAEQLKNNLLFKANEVDNNKLFTIVGIISIIALGVILAFIIFDHSPAAFWSVEKISGQPVIESKVLTSDGIIKIGEKLFTDYDSRARLKVGTVGEIDVEPQSELQIVETSSSEHMLILSRGKINARTWVVPKLFSIKTPSADVKDLGCSYSLFVNDKSSTLLQVTSGWVLLENNNRKSLTPAGASCYSDIPKGPGIPYANDASSLFKESLSKLDFQSTGNLELQKVLSESRRGDLISLFHLIKYIDKESRGMIFDRMSNLFKLSQRISRERIINSDKDMLGRLWVELGLGSISMYQNL